MQTIQQPSWRNYVANIRGDAIDANSPEVAVYAMENGISMEQALDDYRHDFCFFDETLQHWFQFEDGEEVDGEWRHMDAPAIGNDDNSFDYGFVR